MSEPFDPYYKWLGIPPQEQPPNHYRLLGVNSLEADPQVIEAAADRQMAYLRTFQSGQHVQHAQKLLNEISQARVCLLNPSKKAAYDGTLRRPMPPPVAAVPRAVAAPVPQAQSIDSHPVPVITDTRTSYPAFAPTKVVARRRAPAWQQPAVLIVAALVVVLAIAIGIWSQRADKPLAAGSPPVNPPANPGPTNSSESKPAEPAISKPMTPPESVVPVQPAPVTPRPAPRSTPRPDPPPRVSPAPVTPVTPEPAPPPVNVPTSEPLPSVAERKSVPSDAELNEAEKQIRTIFRDEFDKASKPDGKADLARALAGQVAQTAGKPADHYTMLQLARDTAAEAGEAELALNMLAGMATSYKIDAPAVSAAVLTELNKSTKTPEARTRALEAALTYTAAALEEDQYELAERLATLGVNIASKLRETELRKSAKDRQDDVKLLVKQWQTASAAAEKLKDEPDDPAANLAWGKFLCLVKEDWPQGLPLLAKSAEAPIKTAAERELAADKTPEQKSALGDAWFELSKTAPAADRSAIVARAQHWYQDALDELAGLSKTHVERRLEELRPAASSASEGAGMTVAAARARMRKDKEPVAGMVGRVLVDGNDAGINVFYKPGRQLEDNALKEALKSQNVKLKPPLQVELTGVFTVPATDYVYFEQNCRGADAAARMIVDNTELSTVNGTSGFGTSRGLALAGGKSHIIRWIITGRDGIGSCDMRIYRYDSNGGNSQDIPIYYLPASLSKAKTKGEFDLTP